MDYFAKSAIFHVFTYFVNKSLLNDVITMPKILLMKTLILLSRFTTNLIDDRMVVTTFQSEFWGIWLVVIVK